MTGRVTGELIAKCYRNAARAVAAEYEVEPPAECPFSAQDILGSE